MPKTNKGTPVLQAKNNLTDCNIVEIAFAGQPAVPRATFALMKSLDPEGGREAVVKTLLFKKDAVKKQVFGYVLVPDEPDHQGDVLTASEVEKACHSLLKNAFNKTAKGTGSSENHVTFDGIGFPIESCIDTDGAIAKAHGVDPVPGGWWLGAQCTDETWAKIEKGELTGFSIGGSGVRIPVEGAAEKNWMARIMKGLSDLLKAEGDAKSFDEIELMDKLYDELWRKLGVLEASIYSIAGDPEVTDKQTAVAASIDEFRASLLGFFAINKAGRELSEANMAVLEELVASASKVKDILSRVKTKDTTKSRTGGDEMELQELTASVQALTKKIDEEVLPRIDKLEKGDADPGDGQPDGDVTKGDGAGDKEPTMADLMKRLDGIEKNVGDKIDAVTQRVDKIEKTPTGKTGADDDHDDSDDFKPTGDAEQVRKAQLGRSLLTGAAPSRSGSE